MRISVPAASSEEIRLLAKAVHDEIYSVENTLKRRGYEFAGQSSSHLAVLPTNAQLVDEFYGRMASRTFRNVLRQILEKREEILPTDFRRGCSTKKVTEYLSFLAAAGIVRSSGHSDALSFALSVDSFGPTLEWFVAEMFKRELACTSAFGVRIENLRSGGDFDVLARVEAALVWLEIKSGRAENISEKDLRLFLQRDQEFAPDISIFLIDTSDNVSRLITRFEDILSPVIAEASAIRDPGYRFVVECLPEFGRIHHPLRRMFIINSEPSILANLRHCMNYYFGVVAQTSYYGSKRLNFIRAIWPLAQQHP